LPQGGNVSSADRGVLIFIPSRGVVSPADRGGSDSSTKLFQIFRNILSVAHTFILFFYKFVGGQYQKPEKVLF
jgi:hypothetical protein